MCVYNRITDETGYVSSLVNYKCLMYNENTIRYVYAKLEEKLQNGLKKNRKT